MPAVITRDVGASGTLDDTKVRPFEALDAVPSLLVEIEKSTPGYVPIAGFVRLSISTVKGVLSPISVAVLRVAVSSALFKVVKA